MSELGAGGSGNSDGAHALADAIEAKGLPDIRTSLQDAFKGLEPRAWWPLAAQALRIVADRQGSQPILRELLPWKTPHEFWSFRPILELLLPDGPFSEQDVLAVFDATPPSVFSDMALGTYAPIFRGWARHHPGLARDLFDSVAMPSEPDRSFMLLPLAEGIVDAVVAHDYDEQGLQGILAGISSPGDERRFRVYLSLSPLLIENGRISKEEVLGVLRGSIAGSSSELVAATATSTIRFLWKHVTDLPALHALLRQAAADPRPLVRLHLAEVLFHPLAEAEDPDSRTLLEELLMAFSVTDEMHGAIIDKVAWTVFGVAKRDPRLVLRFLRGWVSSRPAGALYLWHSRRFLHVLPELKPEALIPEMIRWLLSGGAVEQAGFVTLTRELELSAWPAGTASSLSDTELKQLVLVLSIRDDNEHSVDLLFSLATQIEDGRDLDGFWETAEQCLAHAVANYRGRAAERIDRLEKAVHSVTRGMTRPLREFDATLSSVQERARSLRELAPPAERSRLWARIEGARYAELMRGAEQDDPGRTPLYHLISKVQLLAPGSFFMARDGEFTGPTPLQAHEVALELPRLALVDPHTEVRRRIHHRRLLRELDSESGQ